MRILVLGAGAVGGYYGARLLQAGGDVTFLVRDRRAGQLGGDGLRIRGAFGDIDVKPQAVTSVPPRSSFDLVLLSCKAYDLGNAMEAIAPAVGASTLVVPLVNGIAQFDALDRRFGAGRVAGGSCHLSGALDDDGTVRIYAPIQRITYGVRPENSSAARPALQALQALFARTPVPAVLSEDIMQELWDKYVLLAALAAMTCLMRASVGDIAATDRGRDYALQVLDTCMKVAAGAGHRPAAAVIQGAAQWITEPGSAFMASMLRDIERGGRTEGDHIVGDMLRRAEAAGIEAALLSMAYCHLQAYEGRRRRETGALAGRGA